MDAQSETQAACIRIDHADHIELRFNESSRKAVDELVAHLIALVSSPPDVPVIRIYVNSGSIPQAQPIRYLMNELRKAQPQLKPDRPTRIAATFNMMPLAQMINLFVTALRASTIRFRAFGVKQDTAALDWLLGSSD